MAGYYKGVQSAGAAVSFGMDAVLVSATTSTYLRKQLTKPRPDPLLDRAPRILAHAPRLPAPLRPGPLAMPGHQLRRRDCHPRRGSRQSCHSRSCSSVGTSPAHRRTRPGGGREGWGRLRRKPRLGTREQACRRAVKEINFTWQIYLGSSYSRIRCRLASWFDVLPSQYRSDLASLATMIRLACHNSWSGSMLFMSLLIADATGKGQRAANRIDDPDPPVAARLWSFVRDVSNDYHVASTSRSTNLAYPQ